MNKRNFGLVIERIEANKKHWKQSRIPGIGETPSCKTPFCFLGLAQYLRTKKPLTGPPNCSFAYTYGDTGLLEWLGLTQSEAIQAFGSRHGLRDFKRWHKAGRVPT